MLAAPQPLVPWAPYPGPGPGPGQGLRGAGMEIKPLVKPPIIFLPPTRMGPPFEILVEITH